MTLKNKKVIEKIINVLLNILIFIFGLIFLISIYTGIQTKILGNKYTNFFGYSLFEVQTGSMGEAVKAGDWIIVKLTQKVKLNEIITYESNGEYITHRVMEVYNGTYVTKGDANNAKDQAIDQKQVVGKVVKILASFGILRKTLFNPAVLITLIITLFLFSVAMKKRDEQFDKNKFVLFIRKYKIDVLLNNISKKMKKIIKKLLVYLNQYIKKENNKKIEIDSKVIEEQKEILEDNSRTVEIPSKSDSELVQSIDKKMEQENKYDFSDYDDDNDDDLDKTSLYRVISIDGVVGDEKEVIEEPKIDELDKTSLYRVVSVDMSDLNDTFLEIAKNQINNSEEKKEIKVEPEIIIEEEEEDENLTKIDLDLLKSKKKNSSIIETSIEIKKNAIENIINILKENAKMLTNEYSIKERFIDLYIDVKYYNYVNEYEIEYNGKSTNIKLEKSLEQLEDSLIKNYHGKNTNYISIVNYYNKLFKLIYNLEKAYLSIDDTKIKVEYYKKEINKFNKNFDEIKIGYMIKEIFNIQKKYSNMLNYFLKKLETNMFELKYNKTITKNMCCLTLEHNLNFSKVYSDYVIDKTYKEGIIAEDKMTILLTLLSSRLVKDMIDVNFDNNYILNIPSSLYSKEKKLEKLFKMIDNKYAKNHIIVTVTLSDLIKNKQIIKKLRKEGYKFALIFEEDKKIKISEIRNLYIVNYMFVDRSMKDIISIIPKDIEKNIIYENIIDKIGDLGGE